MTSNTRLKLGFFLTFLVLALLVNSVGVVALQAQSTFGVGQSRVGLLAGFKSLGVIAASLFAVHPLARFGRRRTMLATLAGLIALCLILPLVSSFAVLNLFFIGVGAAFGVLKICVYSAVGLITEGKKQHASFMSFLESVFTAGIVSGYFLFSAFSDEARPASAEWLRAFYIVAALAALAFALLSTSSGIDDAPAAEIPRAREQRLTIFHLNANRAVLWFAVCVLLYVMAEQGILNWLPTFNRHVLELPAKFSIRIASLLTVALALGRLVGGLVLRRVAWFGVTALGLVVAAGLVVLALVGAHGATGPIVSWTNAPAAAYILPLVGFVLGPIYPAIYSAMLSALPLRAHGAASSLGVMFSTFGSAVGTIALGFLFEAYGGQSAFFFVLIPIMALLGGLWAFQGRLRAAPTETVAL
jgi:FHS family glucose/mannose:H+ symporter-like MFS transporter